MPDKEQNNQSDFLIEKIKTRPINRKKLIRRTVITAAMAVIFGLIACVTFLVLEPIISNWLYPEEDPQYVIFPEDQEEMSPEEMLAENLPAESPSPTPQAEETDPDSELDPEQMQEDAQEQVLRQMQELLDSVELGVDDYMQLYSALQDIIYHDRFSEDGEEYTAALSQHIVTVRGVTSNIDWFDNVQESSNQTSGVIVADNGKELLILVNYTGLRNAENLVLDLNNGGYLIDVKLKGVDRDTNLAVVAVERNKLPEESLEVGGLAVATLGSSNGSHLAGTPVIAMGSPMGVNDSIGYGMITSASVQLTSPDRKYKLLMTDINGSRNAEGVLFNLQGQVIGIIMSSRSTDTGNLVNAYGITEIKKVIEKLSNEIPFAYLGITGTDVTAYAHSELGVPYGAYVTGLEMDSPAMLAGIQVGDVVTAIDDTNVQSFSGYCTQVMQMEPRQRVTLTVLRQAQDEYREMSFSMELGER